jgi:regulator of sigma D
MPVTKQDIQARFGGHIEQIDSKQLFVVNYPAKQLLVSYLTIVGYRAQGAWLLTKAKYSHTTSKHLNMFARHQQTIVWLEQEHLEELVQAARGKGE